MKYYEILQVKETDTLEVIKKKYKLLARKWHPDRHPKETKLNAEIKFKEISKAYQKIKEFHNRNRFDGKTGFYGKMHTDTDFKNFTEKLINKGNILKNLIDKAKNIDLKNFFGIFFEHIKKFRSVYDDVFSEKKTDDLIINVNVSLEDIYNNEDKLVKIKRRRKCKMCYGEDLKFCISCNNTMFTDEEKTFIFSCSDKLIIFSGESNEELKHKTGDLIFKINPKIHKSFSILNNYDILYEVKTKEQKNISHIIDYLDKKKYIFNTNFPFSEHYIIENKGLPVPYSEKKGDLIIKIIYEPFTINNDSKFSFNQQEDEEQ
jgi:DnaJ-class molecular chaperone